jgi:hypothetical protein
MSNMLAAVFIQTRSQSVRTGTHSTNLVIIRLLKKNKIMTMDCWDCLHAKIAKKREENAAVHTAVDKSTTHGELAKEKEKKAAVHTAVDKLTSHPRPTKKVRWEEASK